MCGEYPIRQVTLYAANETILRSALTSSEWKFWWQRLERLVTDIDYCVLPARDEFQFCPE